MKLYKLTNQDDTTFKGTKWGKGVTHKATGKDEHLCSSGFIHAYRDPHQAVFMNPIHGNFQNPHIWECEGDVVIDDTTKVGCKSMTTIKRTRLPRMTTMQRVEIAIHLALIVYKEKDFKTWADNWLSGKDRSRTAAEAAADAAEAAAARTAKAAAAWAAAWAATKAADAAVAKAAAGAAAEAAWAAAGAAWAGHNMVPVINSVMGKQK